MLNYTLPIMTDPLAADDSTDKLLKNSRSLFRLPVEPVKPVESVKKGKISDLIF